MSKKKAGRLAQPDLSNAIAMAAGSARSRIEKIDDASVDAVSGANGPADIIADIANIADVVDIGIGGGDDIIMGMFPSNPIGTDDTLS